MVFYFIEKNQVKVNHIHIGSKFTIQLFCKILILNLIKYQKSLKLFILILNNPFKLCVRVKN